MLQEENALIIDVRFSSKRRYTIRHVYAPSTIPIPLETGTPYCLMPEDQTLPFALVDGLVGLRIDDEWMDREDYGVLRYNETFGDLKYVFVCINGSKTDVSVL